MKDPPECRTTDRRRRSARGENGAADVSVFAMFWITSAVPRLSVLAASRRRAITGRAV
jgi:hypothetical protein